MWREYTKETPARAGWGVVAMALALTGTTGLAYFVAVTKAAPGAVLPKRVSEPGWPISFALPGGFRLLRPDVGEESVSRDGMSGELHGLREGGRGGPAIVAVRFKVQEDRATLSKAFAKWTGQEAEEGEAIKVGSLEGLAMVTSEPRGLVKYTAVAVLPEGLVIAIAIETTNASARARRQFEAVCESVQFKDWFVRVGGRGEWFE